MSKSTTYKANHIISSMGDVTYYNNFLLHTKSTELYTRILEKINWAQYPIKIFGKTYLQPRLIEFQGDKNIKYSYSDTTLEANEWSEEVSFIKTQLQKLFALNFNCVLINQYRNGQDSMGWHSDNEKELGTSPLIASVSLGAERKIRFRNIKDHSKKVSVILNHGSLLIMKGKTQNNWEHQIPKSKIIKSPRINLTFRTIL
ncbi:MAG: alpha-ketoglutarate-dependent dioxygenase AlkB [Saprospiraceae bacterium]|nr:alpha-ketoglutarate-dependent dioxygenase AlkB [Saprospiraceae bacterium]